MKKVFIFILILISNILTGCQHSIIPNTTEINELEMVQVMGIDKSSEYPYDIEVTVISRVPKGSAGKEPSGIKETSILSEKGPTLFEAVRRVKDHTDKTMFFGNIDYFVFGEEAAEEDFTKYFDAINRNEEVRLTPMVFISEGYSAKEFLYKTSTNNQYIVDRLRSLKEDVNILSKTSKVKIIDVSSELNDSNSVAVIPILKCRSIQNEKHTFEMPEKDISPGGYGIIKDFKLVGILDENISRGYNFLVNKVKTTPVSVRDSSGRFVGLEVIDAVTRVEPHFKGDELQGATYRTYVKSNIAEQHSKENIYTKNQLQDLSNKQSQVLEDEMLQVLEKSRDLKADTTNLAREIRMKHPIKWKKLERNWSKNYPKLNIDVVVESHIQRTYNIHHPNGYPMEE